MDQVKIFEYQTDLGDWAVGGNSHPVTQRMTCELVQDMLGKLESADGPTASAYFTHSNTIQLFLTGLGFAYMDTPLRADNYAEMADRKWISSKISPLSSNIAAVRYDCVDGVKVQFLHDERPLQLDGCVDGLCDWATVKSKYAEVADATCSTYFCSSTSSIHLLNGLRVSLILMVLVRIINNLW